VTLAGVGSLSPIKAGATESSKKKWE